MKLYATYGLTNALFGAVLTLVLFLLGYHGEKIAELDDWRFSISIGLLTFAISITVQVLGMRAWRTAAGPKGMSYGRGLGVGTLIGLWNGLGTAVFTILYALAINPNFKDAILANKVAEMEAKGLPPQAIAMAEKVVGFFLNPVVQGVTVVFWSMFVAVIVGLIAAAVLKQAPAPEALTDESGMPVPPLA